jgi:hypothetical protein
MVWGLRPADHLATAAGGGRRAVRRGHGGALTSSNIPYLQQYHCLVLCVDTPITVVTAHACIGMQLHLCSSCGRLGTESQAPKIDHAQL